MIWRAAAICLLASTAAALADEQPTAPPPGAVAFCLREPDFCPPRNVVSAPLSSFNTLYRINALVNDHIEADHLTTDQQKRDENRNWRVVMPGATGACVEYAATKEMLLAWNGIPQDAMRLAQVRANGEFHAVLLVNVGATVVVLDNLTGTIWPAAAVQYEWIAAQDPVTGLGWVSPEVGRK